MDSATPYFNRTAPSRADMLINRLFLASKFMWRIGSLIPYHVAISSFNPIFNQINKTKELARRRFGGVGLALHSPAVTLFN